MIILITLILVYLGWLDYALTSVILALGGIELNPLLVPLVNMPYFLAVKIGFPIAFGLSLYYARVTGKLGLNMAIFVKGKRADIIFKIVCFVLFMYLLVTAWVTFDLYRHLV